MFQLTPKELRAVSLTRAITAAAGNGLTDGLEAEVFRDYAQSIGTQFTPHRFPIPWQVLKRDMTVAGVSGSNYIVGSDNLEAAQALRPFSVVLQSGATVMPDRRGSLTLPRASASATGYWLADESTAITESQPTIGQLNMTPKTCGAIVEYSHQMRSQSNIDAFLSAHLLQTIGRTLDAAALAGTGSNGQPQGIVGTSGVHAESGTSLAWAGIQNMLQQVADAGAQDGQLAFVGTPSVRELLSKRERAAGSGLVWDGRTVAGFTANVTTDAPAASLFLGAWQELLIALWGPIEVAVNPGTSGNFSKGLLQMRVMMMADIGIRHPAAFAVASSIT